SPRWARATACACTVPSSSCSRAEPPMASLAVSDTPDGHRLIALAGRLDASTVPSVWGPAHRALDDAATQPVTVDTAAVESCDGAGIALLVDLASHPRAAPVEVVHMRPDVATLFRQFD